MLSETGHCLNPDIKWSAEKIESLRAHFFVRDSNTPGREFNFEMDIDEADRGTAWDPSQKLPGIDDLGE